jgi:hypothetical protein
MNYEIDLDIKNYSLHELENFIGLDSNYTYNDVNNRCSNMIDVVSESKDYNISYKKRIIGFVNEAKLLLVKRLKKNTTNKELQNENVPDFIEDYDKLVIPSDEDKIINKTSTTYAGHSFVMNKDTVSFNDIINKSEYLNPIESFPTNIARSDLNNLKRKTILQTLVLNTLFREDYSSTTSTDFNIVLPYYFKNVLSVRLSSIQLPNVIYTISSYNGNNTFYLYEDGTGISGKIEIPNGNYFKIDDFAIQLQTEINAQLGISPQRFMVDYDNNSHKITISNNAHNFTMNFYTPIPTVTGRCDKVLNVNEGYRKNDCVDISEIYKKLGWIIGYRKAEYVGSNSYTTEGIYNGSYPNYIYFILNDYNNSQSQNVFGLFSKSIIGDNILAMIPVTSESFYVNYNNGTDLIEKKREYFGPVRIQRMKIQLLNQYGEQVNLNSMDYSFSLEFEVGYDY